MSSQCIVWRIEGQGSPPENVFVCSNIHYFWWKEQFFPPHPNDIKRKVNKILNRLFPEVVKAAGDSEKNGDFEPIYSYHDGKKDTLVSRFHYAIIVIWTSPKIKRGKPVAFFIKGPHTPLVQVSDDHLNKWVLYRKMKSLTPKQRLGYPKIYTTFLDAIWKVIQDNKCVSEDCQLSNGADLHCQNHGNCKLADYPLTIKEVPSKVKLDFKNTLFCYYVGGRQAERHELPPELGSLLFDP